MKYNDIWMIPGIVSKATLLATATAEVRAFPRQTDQIPHWRWLATQVEHVPVRGHRDAVSGKTIAHTGHKVQVNFAVLTADMLDYLYVNILESQLSNIITMQIWHPHLKAIAVYGRLFFDPTKDGQRLYDWPQEDALANVQFSFRRGHIAPDE